MFSGGSTHSRETFAVFFGLCLILISGCAQPYSDGKTFSDGQKNLPDDGYWLCRLDYVQASTIETFYSFERRRNHARTMISGQCEASPAKKICSTAISLDQIECVRAKNIGGIPSKNTKTYCSVEFEGGTSVGAGPTHLDAARAMIQDCLASESKALCTTEILDGKAVCSYL